ncbi:MAG: serine hydrolase, partial [Casimicrobium sp.]
LNKLIVAATAIPFFVASSPLYAKAAPATEATYDAAIASLFKADVPGAAIIVTKDGKTVFRRAYGLADVEKKTPLTPDAVMRIGSITKQFTAVAIMMLEEQGKLNLQDEITKHLPDYPAPKQRVTVEHLLTHTSGIRSYTNKPTYAASMAKEMTVAQMIDTFKNDPLEFAPGRQFRYNNSGYFLLGAIVEKVSGMSYAEFLAKNVFVPLDMKDTAHEGFERSGGRKRIEGYGRRADQFVASANTVHMSQPYAAGALISTVDDLARWDAAIAAGKLLKSENWKRVFTPYTLSDGKKSAYGYGWNIGKTRGRESIEHGGGINGFLSHAIRIPSEGVYVALVTNTNATTTSTSYITEKLAAIAIGDPYPEFKPAKLDAKTMDEAIGVYKIDDKENRTISREGEAMFLQRTGRPKLAILAASASEYFVENSFTSIRFNRDPSGEVISLTITLQGSESTSPRVSKEVPKGRVAIAMSATQLDRFIGEYQLAPNFSISIRREGERLLAQATGQSANEIFPESDTKFFLKVVDAQLQFALDSSGRANEVTLIQNGASVPGKRTK